MPTAVEIVGDAKCEIVPQVALESEIRLLRVGIDEVLGLRISERLKRQWEETRWLQIILIDEQARIEGIESLLTRQIAGNIRQARTGSQNTLKDIGRV